MRDGLCACLSPSTPCACAEVLTNNINNGYKASDTVLWACSSVTALDMLVHFFLRVYRIQQESQTSINDLLQPHR